MTLGLVTEADGEELLLTHARGSKAERARFDAVLRLAIDRAKAELAAFGFAEPKIDDSQMYVEIAGSSLTVTAHFYRVIDLRPMRRWANEETRALALAAVEKMFRTFGSCIFADQLYETAYSFGELFPIVQAAANHKTPDFDAFWKDALICAESAGIGEGDEVYGIGGREEFEAWLKMQVAAKHDRRDFTRARASGCIDRQRSKAVRDWARRATAFCAAWDGVWRKGLVVERDEFRDIAEQAIVQCGRGGAAIDWYFTATDDGSGELPGAVIKLQPGTGRGLIEGLVFAFAGHWLFKALLRALR